MADQAAKSRLMDLKLQMPTLTGKNFIEWNEELRNIEYFGSWDPSIIDIDQDDPDAWDGEEGNVKSKRDRRDAYAIIRLTIAAEFKHILSGTRPGDAKDCYKRLFNRFCRLTSGAISGLKKELENFSMASSGLSIEVFGSKLQNKHTLLLKIQKKDTNNTTDADLRDLLLQGLLVPEFTPIVIYLQMLPPEELTFKKALQTTINFAQDRGYIDLKRGKTMMVKPGGKTEVCRYFVKTGKCRYGDKCHRSHPNKSSNKNDKGTKNTNPASAPTGVKCFNCGENHYKSQCPNKTQPEEEKYPINEKSKKQINLMIRSIPKPSSIIIDSACTEHICPSLDAFVPDSIEDHISTMSIGNGTENLQTSNIGQIKLHSLVQGETTELILNDVLYAPDCPYSIISERILDDKKCRIVKEDGVTTVTHKPTNEVILTAQKRDDELYHVDASIIYPSRSKCLSIQQGVPHQKPLEPLESVENCTKNGEICTDNRKNPKIVEKSSQLRTESSQISTETHEAILEHPDQNQSFGPTFLYISPKQVHHEHVSRNHVAFSTIRRELGLPPSSTDEKSDCDSCLRWNTKTKPKSKKKSKNKKKIKKVLEEVEIDIGYMNVPTWNMEFYFQVVVDVASRKFFTTLMKLKSQSFEAWQWVFKRWLTEKPHLRLGKLRGGCEYLTNVFKKHAKENGYQLDITSPHSEKAWIVERAIGLLRRATMPTIDYAGSSLRDWGFAIKDAETTLNDSRTLALPAGLTRNQAWDMEYIPDEVEPPTAPKINQFNVWGALAAVKVKFGNHHKTSDYSTEFAMYLGRSDDSGGRPIVRLLKTGRIFSTKNVDIINHRFPCKSPDFAIETAELRAISQEAAPLDAVGGVIDLQAAATAHGNGINSWNHPSIPTDDLLSRDEIKDANHEIGIINESKDITVAESSARELRENPGPSSKALENIVNNHSALAIKKTKKRFKKKLTLQGNNIYPFKTPLTETQVENSPQKEYWEDAKTEEMTEVNKQGTYVLEPRPKGIKVIPSRFVYKIKWKLDPACKDSPSYIVERFKARWIAQGYGMTQGIDFNKSYSFTLANDSDRIMVCLSVFFCYYNFSIDFKNFYLSGELEKGGEEKIYVEQAPGFEVKGENGEDLVCLVSKGLYGYPPSGRVAQVNLINTMKDKANFTQADSEPMIFNRKPNNDAHIISGYYVDDGRFATNNLDELKKVENILNDNGLKGKMQQNPSKFIGTEYDYHEDGSITCHQSQHVIKTLSEMGMMNVNSIATPMDPNYERIMDEEVVSESRIREYQVNCGNLIWLLRYRFDIAFAVQTACSVMSKPTESDFKLIKRIARYLRGQIHRGITYRPPTIKNANLRTYAYVDSAIKAPYPISGIALFLGVPDFDNHINRSAAVIVQVKKEKVVALSSMDGEIMAIIRGFLLALWVTGLRNESGFPQTDPTIIFTDNLPAIKFITGESAAPSQQTRHIRRRVAFLKDAVAHNELVLKWVPTQLNCADTLTKPLNRALFDRHTANIMGDR